MVIVRVCVRACICVCICVCEGADCGGGRNQFRVTSPLLFLLSPLYFCHFFFTIRCETGGHLLPLSQYAVDLPVSRPIAANVDTVLTFYCRIIPFINQGRPLLTSSYNYLVTGYIFLRNNIYKKTRFSRM